MDSSAHSVCARLLYNATPLKDQLSSLLVEQGAAIGAYAEARWLPRMGAHNPCAPVGMRGFRRDGQPSGWLGRAVDRTECELGSRTRLSVLTVHQASRAAERPGRVVQSPRAASHARTRRRGVHICLLSRWGCRSQSPSRLPGCVAAAYRPVGYVIMPFALWRSEWHLPHVSRPPRAFKAIPIRLTMRASHAYSCGPSLVTVCTQRQPLQVRTRVRFVR